MMLTIDADSLKMLETVGELLEKESEGLSEEQKNAPMFADGNGNTISVISVLKMIKDGQINPALLEGKWEVVQAFMDTLKK